MEAFITGASSGIGKSVAMHLAAEGYNLLLTGRNIEKLNEIKHTIEKEHAKCKVCIIAADLTIIEDLQKLIDFVTLSLRRIDIFVHAAANYQTGQLLFDGGHLLKSQIDLQLSCFHTLLNGILPLLNKYSSSMIFVIGSIVGQNPRAEAAQYSIAKAAQETYCKLMADELRDAGIKLSLIIPGSVDTPSWDYENNESRHLFVKAEDISKCIIQCIALSPEAWIERIVIRPRTKNI